MQASAETIWAAAQEHLRIKLTPDTYNLWFAPLRASAQENNTIVLEVANDFCEVWLKDNYVSLLQDVIAVVSGRQLDIKFKVGPGAIAPAGPARAIAAKAKNTEVPAERIVPNSDLTFNPKH